MTEVLLLLLALLLALACGVFVAAEFSLTTVERGRSGGPPNGGSAAPTARCRRCAA